MTCLAVSFQVLLVWLLLVCPGYTGEVFTWKDADGNIHITDRPPENGSPTETVIPYSDQPETETRTKPVPQQPSAKSEQVEQLEKRLKRLNERKIQLQQFVAESKDGIASATKDADYYSRRSGPSARRIQKGLQRQLVELNNNLAIYQSDLRYVEEDIADAEERLKVIALNLDRTDGEPE